MIKLLNEQFVPFAGNTAEYQLNYGADGDAAKWYSAMTEKTGYKVQGETTQGMYIAGADGTAYAWKNTPGVSDTIRFMQKGIADFKAKPPQKVEISEPPPQKFAPRATTSVLSVISRVRPVPPDADGRNYNIGRDYLWMYQAEIKEMLAATPETLRLPNSFIARLCRYNFLDLIRGEPDIWEENDVRKADFKVTRTGSKDGVQSFALTGTFKMNTDWMMLGLEGQIDGEFSVDEASARIVRFRAYAKCEGWGAPKFGYRGVPKGRFPLVFAIMDDDSKLAHDVAPSAITRHQEYLNPKVKIFARAVEK